MRPTASPSVRPLAFVINRAPQRRAVCRSCGAPIVWAEIAPGGKAHPFNAADFVVIRDDVTLFDADVSARVEVQATSHFATCPNAAKHRKATR